MCASLGMVPVKIPAPSTDKGSSCNTHTCPWGRPRVLPGHCPTAVRYKQKQIRGPSLAFHTHQVPVPNLQPRPCVFPPGTAGCHKLLCFAQAVPVFWTLPSSWPTERELSLNVPWNPKLHTLVIDCLNPVVICLLVSYPAVSNLGTVAQPLAFPGLDTK